MDRRAYRVQMSEIPNNSPLIATTKLRGTKFPLMRSPPVVDPNLVPDATTPDEKRARRDPEETGS